MKNMIRKGLMIAGALALGSAVYAQDDLNSLDGDFQRTDGNIPSGARVTGEGTEAVYAVDTVDEHGAVTNIGNVTETQPILEVTVADLTPPVAPAEGSAEVPNEGSGYNGTPVAEGSAEAPAELEATVVQVPVAPGFNFGPFLSFQEGSGEEVLYVDTDVHGCIDGDATNFDGLANVDDGTCLYGCVDTDEDEVCDVDEVVGCMIPSAINYNELATDDSGNCNYASEPGCMDDTATNFNELATKDDGSCEYAPATVAVVKPEESRTDYVAPEDSVVVKPEESRTDYVAPVDPATVVKPEEGRTVGPNAVGYVAPEKPEEDDLSTRCGGAVYFNGATVENRGDGIQINGLICPNGYDDRGN